jgi:IstB-like ATP binding protein
MRTGGRSIYPVNFLYVVSEDAPPYLTTLILTSNHGFAEWREVFGDPVVATALLDRLLHSAVVVQVEGASYRLRHDADLIPEHTRSHATITRPPPPKRSDLAPKDRGPNHVYTADR